MIRKTILKVVGVVAIAAGLPPSFSLRTLLALAFGNALGVAAVMVLVPRTFAVLAAIIWIALWSAAILTFAAAHEARRHAGAKRQDE